MIRFHGVSRDVPSAAAFCVFAVACTVSAILGGMAGGWWWVLVVAMVLLTGMWVFLAADAFELRDRSEGEEDEG